MWITLHRFYTDNDAKPIPGRELLINFDNVVYVEAHQTLIGRSWEDRGSHVQTTDTGYHHVFENLTDIQDLMARALGIDGTEPEPQPLEYEAAAQIATSAEDWTGEVR